MSLLVLGMLKRQPDGSGSNSKGLKGILNYAHCFSVQKEKKNTQLFLITFGIRRNFEHHCGNNARINARCALEPNRVLYCIGKKFNKVCAIQMGF